MAVELTTTRLADAAKWAKQSKLERVTNWGRKFSLFTYPFVTACCGMEFMSVAGPKYDIARFGAEFPRFSPRQSDLLMIVGTITEKQGPALKRVYDQMTEPKWVIAFGVCASTGGFYQNYHAMPGADQVIPVDVYIPGCPPRPEQVLPVPTWLKNDPAMAFDSPVFVTCIDRIDWRPIDVPPGPPVYPASAPWNEDQPRFEVVYQLRSLRHRHRLRLKCAVPEHDARVPSLASLWPAFNWQERETIDMYGIVFDGHPDPRRIYLYEEVVGHQLRKDYPKEKRQPLVRG